MSGTRGLAERQMFGGVAFLVRGNMCVGVREESLIARIPPDETDEALAQPHTKIFDITGRPMDGWIVVGAAGVRTKESLSKWVKRARAFAVALPPK